jgi:hypothetical protein
MIDDADKSHELAAEQEPLEPLKLQRHPWSAEDRRLLLITFGGTMAANIATVLVVGGAIAYARWSVGGGPKSMDFVDYLLTPLTVAMLVATAYGAAYVQRTKRSWTNWVVLLPSSFLIASVIMWIGLASGIK